MSLIQELLETRRPLATSSTFTVWNGYAYLAIGALLIAWSGAVQTLFFEPEFVGREEGMVRVVGMTIAIIGWFYIFGGRLGSRQIVAASVVDRLVLIPLVLIPTALAGVFPHVLGAFAVVDPVLGLCAWYLLARERPTVQDASS